MEAKVQQLKHLAYRNARMLESEAGSYKTKLEAVRGFSRNIRSVTKTREMGWFNIVVLLFTNGVIFACGESESSDLKEQFSVLSKQVTTLLDRRRDDLQLIEDSLRKKLAGSQELLDVKDELKNLR